MTALVTACKQLLSYLRYISYIIQPLLIRLVDPKLVSYAVGLVLLLLVLEALAEYLFFWAFHVVVTVIERAFREAFHSLWWILVAALAVLIGVEVCLMIDRPLDQGSVGSVGQRNEEEVKDMTPAGVAQGNITVV